MLKYQRLLTASPLHIRVVGKAYSILALTQAQNGLSAEVALSKATEIDPGEEKNTFTNFSRSVLYLEAAWTSCYSGDQSQAMLWLEKRIDAQTLEPNIAQSGLGRIETINLMTLSSLKTRDRDMEQTIHFWKAGMEGARTLQSQQRFNEAVTNYELMEVVWPGERRIAGLREHIIHWEA